jgi:alpha-N-arabinofuranosidase
LKLTIHGGRYDFAYVIGTEWIPLASNVAGTHLSTRIADGFVSTMIGPFAQGPRAD